MLETIVISVLMLLLVGIATELINSNIREWGENPKEFF